MAIYYDGHPNTHYFTGHCPVFAVALHRLTGLPLAALVEDGCLVHAFVLLEGSSILDASGVSSIEDVLAEFPHDGFAEVVVFQNTSDLLMLGYGQAVYAVEDCVVEDAKTILLSIQAK